MDGRDHLAWLVAQTSSTIRCLRHRRSSPASLHTCMLTIALAHSLAALSCNEFSRAAPLQRIQRRPRSCLVSKTSCSTRGSSEDLSPQTVARSSFLPASLLRGWLHAVFSGTSTKAASPLLLGTFHRLLLHCSEFVGTRAIGTPIQNTYRASSQVSSTATFFPEPFRTTFTSAVAPRQ